jgi:hypothetical protein
MRTYRVRTHLSEIAGVVCDLIRLFWLMREPGLSDTQHAH